MAPVARAALERSALEVNKPNFENFGPNGSENVDSPKVSTLKQAIKSAQDNVQIQLFNGTQSHNDVKQSDPSTARGKHHDNTSSSDPSVKLGQSSATHAQKFSSGEKYIDRTLKAAQTVQDPIHTVYGLPVDKIQNFNAHIFNIFYKVNETGMPNYQAARIPLPHELNMHKWRELLVGYGDTLLADFLEFGWPIAFNRKQPIYSVQCNHASAMRYPEHVNKYITTELGHGALWGPFRMPPPSCVHISALMSRPKKDSQDRRIILDLSWPPNFSINSGIPKNYYVDGTADMRLPTIDAMVDRLLELGTGAWLYKTDLSRGYRQMRVDPLDWPLLGFSQNNDFFLDLCPPFGLRTSAFMMERLSMGVAYIHERNGFIAFPYIDDFGGAESSMWRATDACDSLHQTFIDLGLQVAAHKIVRPTQVMTWLGIEIDSLLMTLKIPPAKISDFRHVTSEWLEPRLATKREIQSIVGSINYIASIAKPARIYSNRILNFLRSMPNQGRVLTTPEFRQDVRFFTDILPAFNGVCMLVKKELGDENRVEIDACKAGCGGFCADQYYAAPWPEHILVKDYDIAKLECLNLVIALKLWAHKWRHHRLHIVTDNQTSQLALSSGRSHVPYLQHCLREVYILLTTFDIDLRVTHAPGTTIDTADRLSRDFALPFDEWPLQVRQELRGKTRVELEAKLFALQSSD